MPMEAPHLERRRFNVEDVMKMVDAGILRDDERVELLHGELVVVSPQGPPHSTATSLLVDALRAAYGAGYCVREAKPLIAGDDELPEPDVAVVRGSPRDYADRHPSGDDAVLVVEAARTSHATDREKIGIYARGGVPVYWLLDLKVRHLEVFTDPQPDGRYRTVSVLAEHETVELPVVGGTLRVAALLP